MDPVYILQDCKGNPLAEGDEVILRAKVTSVHPGQKTGLNVGIEVIDPNEQPLHEYRPALHIHSGLVEKVESAPAVASKIES